MKIPGIKFQNRQVEAACNSVLTQQDLRGIRDAVVETMLLTLTGRTILPIERRPIQEEFFTYWLETQMNDASVMTRRQKARVAEDEPLVALQTALPYVKIEKTFSMHKLDQFASFDAKARYVKQATRQVAEAENDLIFNGCTLPALNGLIAGAGNTTAATAAWSTLPAGDAYEDVNRVIQLMRVDGFMGPYLMACDPINYGELGIREVKAGGSANPYKQLIEEGLLAGPIQSNVLCPHGTAVVIQQGTDVASLLCPEDTTLVIKDLDEITEQIEGVVREAVLPFIFQANGVGTVTGA
jgi:uncharacterized linocin/CFP29 family protein